jgi:hypothetical protein
MINIVESVNPYRKNPRPHVRGEYGEEFFSFPEEITLSGFVLTAA